MSLYMFQARYSVDAFGAMLKEPQDRTAAGAAIVEAAGGKLHALYFCFGDYDVMAIIDAPDDHTMASCAMVLAASGAFSGGKTTKLMSGAEAKSAMEAASGLASSYKPVTG
ncbi:MAG: GYD domain-containing protein [Boseongicola sp.]